MQEHGDKVFPSFSLWRLNKSSPFRHSLQPSSGLVISVVLLWTLSSPYTSFCIVAPKLNRVFKVWPDKHWAEQHNDLSLSLLVVPSWVLPSIISLLQQQTVHSCWAHCPPDLKSTKAKQPMQSSIQCWLTFEDGLHLDYRCKHCERAAPCSSH